MFRKCFAEFLGTFWLVLGGCGSAVLAAKFADVGIGLAGVSLAFGLTVLTGAYAFGPVSGGHFNPAVTVGLWAGGRFAARGTELIERQPDDEGVQHERAHQVCREPVLANVGPALEAARDHVPAEHALQTAEHEQDPTAGGKRSVDLALE